MRLDRNDQLGWVKLTQGDEEIVLVTRKGQAIRFSEEDIRPMGRNAGGVRGIKLARGDRVVGMDLVREGNDLLVVTERGYGKRTPLVEYSPQRRYGVGLRTAKLSPKVGKLAASCVVSEDDVIAIISAKGVIARAFVRNIPRMGRSTQGVTIMDLERDDSVASIVVIRRGEKP